MAKKTTKAKKKKRAIPTSTLRAQCLKAAQLLARISATDEFGYCTCVSCGITNHYKEMHGGHFLAKGHSSYWALEQENIHPQCPGCNMFGMRNGTAEASYTLWMVDTYGRDFVEEMLATKKNTKKMFKQDYVDLLLELKKLIAYHRERVGE